MFPDQEENARGETLADVFAPPPLPPLAGRLTPKVLRFGLPAEERVRAARGAGSGTVSSGEYATGICRSYSGSAATLRPSTTTVVALTT
jgi:hypothetical protein